MEENHGFDDLPAPYQAPLVYEGVQTPPTATAVQMYPVTRQPGSGPAPPLNGAQPTPAYATEAMLRALDPVRPQNHMVIAILSTLLCGCPCGVVSLCHAVQVDMDFDQGNTVGADYNSRQAWRWAVAAIATGCIGIVITLVYFLIRVSIHVGNT